MVSEEMTVREVLLAEHYEQRIAELEAALRPFAEFGRDAPWRGTAWEHQPETADVLVCHVTKKSIALVDFYNAVRVMNAR